MRAWQQRPIEEANLLNPAFCCVALSASVVGYSSIKAEGLPLPLAFMILPIVLHKTTRESLPQNSQTSLAMWIQNNTHLRILFYERTLSLKPYTREALLFGLTHNWLQVTDGGHLQAKISDSTVRKILRTLSGEARECILKSRFIGRWFASAGTVPTVMAFWGIQP